MKAIILTFSKEDNRGANLQAYALFSYLKRNDIIVDFLDIQLPDKTINLKGRILRTINNFLAGRFRMKSGFTFTKKYYTLDELNRNPPQADLYIVGSDQVWNPEITNSLDPRIYFLTFLPQKVRKIAYAASFGRDQWIATVYDSEIKQSLHTFQAIGVREDSGVEICRQFFHVDNVECVLDPTLLLDSKEIDSLLPSQRQIRNQIFGYYLYRNKSIDNMSICISDFLNLPFDKTFKTKGVFRLLQFYGVKTWLKKICKAEFVITNSFHCMVFCILMRKRFVVLPAFPGRETRMLSLLRKIGLGERYFDSMEDLEKRQSVLFEDIDYDSVVKLLENYKLQSFQFIQKAITF